MSYSISGYKWGSSDYGTTGGTVYWNAAIVSGLDYDGGLYSQGDFDTALADAFQAWEDVAQIDFEYTADAGVSDIDVWMEFLSGSTVGEARISYYNDSPLDTIASGEIRMDDSETWAPYGETDLSFFAVALHEIGHIIGLDHVSDTSEIMNDYVSANALGDGDILGAQILYGDAGGGVVDPPDPDPDPDPEPSPSGGGGMGFIVLILAAIAALVGFGGGGLAAAFALGRKDEDEGEEDSHDHEGHNHEDHDHGVLLSDLVPSTGTLSEDVHVLHHFEDEAEDDLDDDLMGYI